ncbi:hypothetical protein K474DRAFT_1705798 [Panus rudis PR-1116 ss-1]|nr:hypothetical protein K474DRAFT_1705798 [Panus rudis PR-1116 ss-1]
MPPYRPYDGYLRKIILALDIGSSRSGAAYSILEGGEVPSIHICSFPGQDDDDDPRTPSTICYTDDGHPVDYAPAAQGNVRQVSFMKALLEAEARGDSVDEHLPNGKSAVQVLGDFVKYLVSCTRSYFIQAHRNGLSNAHELWDRLSTRMVVVLSHPSHWGHREQDALRRAVIAAGLVPDTAEGLQRIHLVTEEEAILYHFVSTEASNIDPGINITAVDAGHEAVNIATHSVDRTHPIASTLVAGPDRLPAGSVEINLRARELIEAKLGNHPVANPEYVDDALKSFEELVKYDFANPDYSYTIPFGPPDLNDAEQGIHSGRVTLQSHEIVSLFEPTLRGIINTVLEQIDSTDERSGSVYLVGGLGSSPYLYDQLRLGLASRYRVYVHRPEDFKNTVAPGALAHFIEHLASTRKTKFAYGTGTFAKFDPADPEHVSRQHRCRAHPSGWKVIPDAFRMLIPRGVNVEDDEETSVTMTVEAIDPSGLTRMSSDILCYMGDNNDPRWMDEEPEKYVRLCTVQADTSNVHREVKSGIKGFYFVQEYRVVLIGGPKNMRAQLSWMENVRELLLTKISEL